MGTRSANVKLGVTLSGAASNLLVDGNEPNGTAAFNLSNVISKQLSNGIAAAQVDRIWQDLGRTLAVGTEVIDLYDFAAQDIGAGVGLDPLGQALALEEIALIMINNKSATGTLLVGGEGSTAAFNALFNGVDTSVLTIPPLGMLLLAVESKPGYDVEDAANHLLQLEAVGGTVTYDIIIAGRSA